MWGNINDDSAEEIVDVGDIDDGGMAFMRSYVHDSARLVP